MNITNTIRLQLVSDPYLLYLANKNMLKLKQDQVILTL
jgi:hypothetical protein